MPQLNPNQAKTLFEIVKFANKHCGRVPSGPEFAGIIKIKERGALERINRILDKADFVRTDHGRTRFIEYNMLITEKESAQWCLQIYDVSEKSPQGRFTITDVACVLTAHPRSLQKFVENCCEAKYLETISSSVNGYRAASKMQHHLEYLKLLAEQE